MIEVESLTRRYANLTAVDDVSFSVGQGEVVGLLGPNGAGKTTIMKMLTGYLEPSSGDIRIDGRDMRSQRAAIQRDIGYLPENCPVYPDMTVVDYLDYQAVLHGVAAGERRAALRRAIARTALGDKALAPVATLSRGYRQRVGVAQAILHEPRLVILDEPTNGLDPAQIRDMRGLIRSLASHATVLISTHILQEVQAVCERVLIMRRGRLALDARLAELGGARRLRVTLDAEPARARKLFGAVEGVSGIEDVTGHHAYYRYALAGETDMARFAPAVAAAVAAEGCALYALEPETRDLETVFAEVNA